MVRCSLETRDGGRKNRYPEERVDSLGISDRGAPKGKFLSILTFDTLELGNGAPFGPVPKGLAPSLLEVREVPTAPIRIIWHQFGFIDV
jgi:hypothetical protein